MRVDGSVVTWGSFGGDSSAVSSQLDGTIDVVQIFSTNNAFAALRADGSVVTWGLGTDGGNSSSVASQLDGSIDVVKVFSNNYAFVALRVDGSVVTWGDSNWGGNSSAVTSQLDGTIDVVQVFSHDGAFAALRSDGSVVNWLGTYISYPYGVSSSSVASQLSSGVVTISNIEDNTNVVFNPNIVNNVLSVATDTNFSFATLSNINSVNLANGVTATFTGSQITGQSWTISGVAGVPAETLVVNSSENTTVNLANITTTNVTLILNGNAGIENLTGTSGADTIKGNAGADMIDGGLGNDTYVYGLTITDSAVTTTSTLPSGWDTATITVGDIFDFSTTVNAVVNMPISSGVTVAATGTLFIGQLNTTFTAADNSLSDVEGAVINFIGGEKYLVVDSDGDQAITAADNVIQLVGSINSISISAGNVVIA